MVANIRTRIPEEKKGTEASWDNVIYQSDSLGYVDASHQLLQQKPAAKNFTYYLPLTKDSCSNERKAAQLKSHEEWVNWYYLIWKKYIPISGKKPKRSISTSGATP
jgi:hypothetical protein